MVTVPAGRMHANEVETDEALVRRVLGLQMRRGRVVAGGRCPRR